MQHAADAAGGDQPRSFCPCGGFSSASVASCEATAKQFKDVNATGSFQGVHLAQGAQTPVLCEGGLSEEVYN